MVVVIFSAISIKVGFLGFRLFLVFVFVLVFLIVVVIVGVFVILVFVVFLFFVLVVITIFLAFVVVTVIVDNSIFGCVIETRQKGSRSTIPIGLRRTLLSKAEDLLLPPLNADTRGGLIPSPGCLVDAVLELAKENADGLLTPLNAEVSEAPESLPDCFGCAEVVLAEENAEGLPPNPLKAMVDGEMPSLVCVGFGLAKENDDGLLPKLVTPKADAGFEPDAPLAEAKLKGADGFAAGSSGTLNCAKLKTDPLE